jgi:curved DNA-binding protein CbpA
MLLSANVASHFVLLTGSSCQLQAAYETLINPEKRKEYDLLYPTICSQRSNSDSSPSRDSNSARPAGSTAPAWPAHEDRVEEMMKQTKDIFTNYKEEEIRWQKEDLESTEEQFEKEIDEILKNGRDQWFSWLGELDE